MKRDLSEGLGKVPVVTLREAIQKQSTERVLQCPPKRMHPPTRDDYFHPKDRDHSRSWVQNTTDNVHEWSGEDRIPSHQRRANASLVTPDKVSLLSEISTPIPRDPEEEEMLLTVFDRSFRESIRGIADSIGDGHGSLSAMLAECAALDGMSAVDGLWDDHARLEATTDSKQTRGCFRGSSRRILSYKGGGARRAFSSIVREPSPLDFLR